MDDTSKTIKIVISGKLAYEDDITLNQAVQIVAFIDSSSGINLAVPASATRLASAQIVSPTGSVTTPREALDGSGARTNPEKIAAFAALILDEGKDTFTLEDVKPLFRRARESTPKNLSRDFDVVVKSGWADEADIKGEYYLTKKALAALESGFERDRQAAAASTGATTRAASSRKPRKAAEIPAAFKDIDPIPNSIDGLPDFMALGLRKDQFLWVLKLAKTLDIDGLTNKEVVWLTDHLGAGIASNNVNSAFTLARKFGHANRSTQTLKIRITPSGEKYLESLNTPKG